MASEDAPGRQPSASDVIRRTSSDLIRRRSSDLVRRHTSALSALSCATSTCEFPEPSQTLIFLDWDDTLFPTSDMMDRWRVPEWFWMVPEQDLPDPCPLPESDMDGLEEAIDAWSKALEEFLRMASTLSERVVILTNAQRPWVERCILCFAPKLRPLFNKDSGHCSVVYAGEALEEESLAEENLDGSYLQARAGSATSCLRECAEGFRIWMKRMAEEDLHREWEAEVVEIRKTEEEDRNKIYTEGKHVAMKRAARQFYSRYSQQTWKNIFSMGDMRYEYQALKDLHNYRAGICERERLRLKAVVVPPKPQISQLTLNLRILSVLFPAMVHHDGGMDLDFRSANPPAAIAEALCMPALESVSLPLHAWGRGPVPTPAEEELALDDLAMSLQDHVASSKETVHAQKVTSARKNKRSAQSPFFGKAGMSFVNTSGLSLLGPLSRRGGS